MRYGLAVGVVSWSVVEMPSHMGLYSEIWLKPADYPITSLIALAFFAGGFVYAARSPAARKAAAAAAAPA